MNVSSQLGMKNLVKVLDRHPLNPQTTFMKQSQKPNTPTERLMSPTILEHKTSENRSVALSLQMKSRKLSHATLRTHSSLNSVFFLLFLSESKIGSAHHLFLLTYYIPAKSLERLAKFEYPCRWVALELVSSMWAVVFISVSPPYMISY